RPARATGRAVAAMQSRSSVPYPVCYNSKEAITNRYNGTYEERHECDLVRGARDAVPCRHDRNAGRSDSTGGAPKLRVLRGRPRIRRGGATTRRAWSAGTRQVSPPSLPDGRAASG